ncbi:hypothetical protein AB0469_27850 [Streptomyces sp. NPDC093801]|uniref:hypothetical protein n=1 Tax=Streptomyces sp. NPDC093801 TaxID=3155203 RepID=UPI00344B393F
MHPTRTSTKLLLGAACAVSAVSAVSGCVNVSPAPMRPAGSADGGQPRHEPRRGPGPLVPVVVEAPALEALKAVPRDGSVRPSAPTVAGPGTARTAPPSRAGGPESEEAAQDARAVPDIPEPRRPAGHAQRLPDGLPGPVRPDARVPRELARELPVRPADVCALGRRHGHWQPDSPESRICAGVHEG